MNKRMNSKTGYLLIHGFGGNINEVAPLADFLKEGGYIVLCPVLKGHTGKRSDLSKYSYQDWILSVKNSYDELSISCEEIYMVGFSMGGLIALELSSQLSVNAIVTLNTPIYFWDFKNILLYIFHDIKNLKLNNTIRYIQSCTSFPIKSLINFRLLLFNTKRSLSNVKCPLLIIQSLKDDAVKAISANYIYEHVSSEDTNIKFYNESGHLILWSKAANNVIKDIYAFFEDVNTLDKYI
ncbi:alpha/beta fold hydrolase [Alkalibaculum sp. M08DMB]|uniref:Alpha/beta fold hydrolase n=1 Tax=Alkalibaculum sporogenes TaxID=2655001 RepID=A0A6A7K993_9FIRM|nr:alpha/beta fold hydrolase [Alkalibaculum sporogenes]MPW25881.1 alpha/beta fold hydrolase [Alkalibaculum sporogenes]